MGRLSGRVAQLVARLGSVSAWRYGAGAVGSTQLEGLLRALPRQAARTHCRCHLGATGAVLQRADFAATQPFLSAQVVHFGCVLLERLEL